MDVGTWFRRRMAMPFLALGAAFLAASVALALTTFQARQRSAQQARERFEHVASIALQQRNRPLLESALATLRSETGSTDVAMCEGESVLLALPARQNACHPQALLPWTSVQRVTLPAFTEGEVFLHSPRWPHLSFISGLAALGLLLVVGVVEVVRRAAREFARELVHPLVTRAYDTELCDEKPETAPASCIRELNALVDAHRASIADVKRLAKEVAAHAVTAAIARTTQALAHDVRKPFSMFKSIIHIVEGTEDPKEVREVLKVTLPEVNQAMASVEGMLQDVMQIGAEATLNLEDTAPEALVEAALGDLFRVYANADVSLGYSFAHRNRVRADSVRLGRVFANILGNAVQAMHEKGRMWIRTSEHGGFVEFTLGNAGSMIPAESLPKLFDAFFTSNKKGGTGLGLAIAKKIVEAHGGMIRCLSEKNDKHPGGMVEFVFTLPASSAVCEPRSDTLPKCSRDIQSAFAAVRIAERRQAGAKPDSHEAEVEAILLARLETLCSPKKDSASGLPTVLVVDDEAVYRNGLLSLLDRSEALSSRIRMVFARNDAGAFAAVKEHAPVLLIQDVDLEPTSKCGLEIVRGLRKKGFGGHICVHSNRFLGGEAQAALAAGADSVLPKPMGRAHLMKLILASLPDPEPEAAVTAAKNAPSASEQKLNVAALDDSLSFRLAWKMQLEKETRFRAFASTADFFDTCEREPSYLTSLDVVVTDYNFAPCDPHDGGTFARELHKRGYGGLVLRASGETDLGPEIEALFHGDVGKGALEWAEFQRAVETARFMKAGRLRRL